jgi:sigma-B regulation protein RsbU (phosphoserine phosphatase)
LPPELPKVEGWEIASHFKAAREVAGDFYDAFLLPDGNLACVIGDVCGKGVGAALFMTLFRSLLRATAISDITSSGNDMSALAPEERLSHVISFTNNYVVKTHFEANMFATVFMGIISPEAGTLTYMNCGNEPPLVRGRGGLIIPLPPTGPVVGVIEDARFSTKMILMEENNLLLAFTDGITDALNADNISFGTEPLLKILGGVDTTAAALLNNIEEQLHQFINGADPFDDITLLAMKREG